MKSFKAQYFDPSVTLCTLHIWFFFFFFKFDTIGKFVGSENAIFEISKVPYLYSNTIWCIFQNFAYIQLYFVYSRNFATVAVRQALSSRCNMAHLSKCSLRQIHMESNKKSDSRGALIVLEGLDRCGKTSQCSRLLSYLEELGHAVESWRFPDRNTGVGQMISSYLANDSHLDDHAIHLLFSANRWEKRLTSTYLCMIDLSQYLSIWT